MKNVVFILLLLLLLLSTITTVQIVRGEYCSCKEADKLESLNNYYSDSLYATYKEDTAGITVSIINTTKDTIYIFSSYLQQQFLGSKYLHRIELNKRRYKLSLLPVVPHVFTKYSDVVIASDEAIMGDHQILYDFIKLLPGSGKEIEFKYRDLFKNKNEKNNISKDYNVRLLSKNSKVPRKFYTTSKLPGKYDFCFEFAVYKSVDFLCKQTAYYMQAYEFDRQSKSFNVLTIPVKVNKYKYALLK
jgi:hypothetical protein